MTNLATSYKPAPAVSDSIVIGDYVLTAQFDGMQSIGFSLSPSFGAISPANLNGAPIALLWTLDQGGGNFDTYFGVTGVVAQDFFASITINGTTRLTSAANFLAGATTVWQWVAVNMIPSEGSYGVEFG